MPQVIIYKHEGGVALLRPTALGLKRAGGDVHKLARKDVPSGVKYKVIDASEIPTDFTFRNAWEVDEALLTDGTGSASNLFED